MRKGVVLKRHLNINVKKSMFIINLVQIIKIYLTKICSLAEYFKVKNGCGQKR